MQRRLFPPPFLQNIETLQNCQKQPPSHKGGILPGEGSKIANVLDPAPGAVGSREGQRAAGRLEEMQAGAKADIACSGKPECLLILRLPCRQNAKGAGGRIKPLLLDLKAAMAFRYQHKLVARVRMARDIFGRGEAAGEGELRQGDDRCRQRVYRRRSEDKIFVLCYLFLQFVSCATL